MTKILLIEDNPMNRDMLVRRLHRHGFQMITAENGHLGLLAARSESPELILMDMSLPEMDGWELTRILKSDAATRHVPIIALTAHAMVGDRENAIHAGCDDYDTKPVDLQRLLGKIQSSLEKSNPQFFIGDATGSAVPEPRQFTAFDQEE